MLVPTVTKAMAKRSIYRQVMISTSPPSLTHILLLQRHERIRRLDTSLLRGCF